MNHLGELVTMCTQTARSGAHAPHSEPLKLVARVNIALSQRRIGVCRVQFQQLPLLHARQSERRGAPDTSILVPVHVEHALMHGVERPLSLTIHPRVINARVHSDDLEPTAVNRPRRHVVAVLVLKLLRRPVRDNSDSPSASILAAP